MACPVYSLFETEITDKWNLLFIDIFPLMFHFSRAKLNYSFFQIIFQESFEFVHCVSL